MSAPRVVDLATGECYRPRKARKARAEMSVEQAERMMQRRVIEQKLDRTIEHCRAIADYLSAPSARAAISYEDANSYEMWLQMQRNCITR